MTETCCSNTHLHSRHSCHQCWQPQQCLELRLHPTNDYATSV